MRLHHGAGPAPARPGRRGGPLVRAQPGRVRASWPAHRGIRHPAAAGARQRAAGLRARPAAGIGAAARLPMAGAGRPTSTEQRRSGMSTENDGQVVVVTGASGGSGTGTALGFAGRGAKWARVPRGEAGLDVAVRYAHQAVGTALPIRTNSADADQLEAGATQAE